MKAKAHPTSSVRAGYLREGTGLACAASYLLAMLSPGGLLRLLARRAAWSATGPARPAANVVKCPASVNWNVGRMLFGRAH